MQYKSIIRIVGMLIGLFSLVFIPPAIVALVYKDGGGLAFVESFVVALFLGALLWIPTRNSKADLRAREGFLIVVLFWTVLGLIGALPFALSPNPDLNISDSVFESFSGLTTTGATVLVGLETLPKAILFYRHLLQWLGGMGIIVLAVAIMPLLGIGGMQLYRAETPGPMKDSKMTPRIAGTAKALWNIYLALTICCAIAFYLAGMSIFDAVCHSFSTIAIGGFSTYDASIGYFDSSAINWICVTFLVISGINFSLHYSAIAFNKTRLIKLNPFIYFKDKECLFFLSFQLFIALICFLTLYAHSEYESGYMAFEQAAFQAVSIATTAGFATDNFAAWPVYLPVLLICASCVGGCAGSTGGGMKAIRVLLLSLQGVRELKRLVNPKAIYVIRLGKKTLSDRVIDAVWGFFSAYTLIFLICLLLLMATGMDELSAFSATIACLNNLGPGLGDVAANYGDVSDSAKWILSLAMLFGRLEIFTLLVLFTPVFWRQ